MDCAASNLRTVTFALYQSSNITEPSMSHVRIPYETFQKTAPGAQAALLAMGKSSDESGLDKTIVELAKLRVSQINNCAFCLQIHLNVSRKHAIAQEKLDLVATWEEAGIFSEKECAALAWAERLAHLAGGRVSDEDYTAVRQHFSEEEVVFLSVSIATINAWNRLGAAFRFAPPILPRR
jgi:AhpD family alkylhydroperoxidase